MSLEQYREQFANLRRDVSKKRWNADTQYGAPHKPLLLLALLDAAEQGELASPTVEIRERFIAGFQFYWLALIPSRLRGDFCKPFFHMRSSPFWTLIPQPGMAPALDALQTVSSMSVLYKTVLAARIDDDLHALIHQPDARDKLRAALISTYFSAEFATKLRMALVTNHRADIYAKQLTSQIDQPPAEVADPASVPEAIRSHGFRRAVTAAYAHQCAICGLRILTDLGHSAVEAAHIVPWADRHIDDIRNGLALCKLCHWAFDELLLSIDRKHTILVSPSVSSTRNFPGHIAGFRGRSIHLPTNSAMAPAEEFLAHHRKRYRLAT